ncbi:MAG: hypothetical protein ABEJ73_10250 [Haloplanus sp.]
MNRDVSDVVVFVLTLVVTVGTVAVPAAALGATAPATTQAVDAPTGRVAPQADGNGTANATATATPERTESAGNESLAPGQKLAGVVGVQGAEIDGEIEERTLTTRVSRTESNASKAAVVATDLNRIRDRLQTLRERKRALREARQSGELSTGEYRARMAVTSARIQAVQTQIESNEEITRSLPEPALESHGVNRTEIDRLRQDADELQGPEVAEIARQVAGKNPGREFAPERGPDDLPAPARDGEDEAEDDSQGNAENAGPPADGETPDDTGPPEDGETPDDTGPPEDTGNDGDSARNRSTSGETPDDAKNSNRSDESPGNSSESGSSGSSEDGAGNSGESGSSGGSEDGAGNSSESGSSSGSDESPGNSGESGSSGSSEDGESGSSSGSEGGAGTSGNSGSSGNSGGSSDSGNSGNSDGAENSGDQGGGR